MFKVGPMIMHPNAGVCKIEDIRLENFISEQMYYVLKPVYEKSNTKIYVPVENTKITLRKLLTRDDIKELIHNVTLDEELWVENNSRRNEKFNAILCNGNHSEIIGLIIEIHVKQEEKKKLNKKLHMTDIRTMQEAEKMIHQKFAYALNLKIDEVAPYLMNELNIINM